jgi:hypothetical protein
VETHGVFSGDEIQPPLGLTLQFPGGLRARLSTPAALAASTASSRSIMASAALLQQVVVAVLDQVHAGLQLLLREVMAGLAGAVDVQQRAAHPVVGNLGGPFPHVGHVAVGTGDAAAGVDALAPQFEFRMLGLQDLRPRSACT